MLWSTFLGVKSASLESHEDLSSRLDGLQYRRTFLRTSLSSLSTLSLRIYISKPRAEADTLFLAPFLCTRLGRLRLNTSRPIILQHQTTHLQPRECCISHGNALSGTQPFRATSKLFRCPRARRSLCKNPHHHPHDHHHHHQDRQQQRNIQNHCQNWKSQSVDKH
jgi:hypothetical protein